MDFRLTSVVLAAALCVGCSSTKLPDTPAAATSAVRANSDKSATAGTPARSGDVTARATAGWSPAGQKAPALESTVHFDFDSAQVRQNDKPVIEAHARYLAANRAAKAKIEGNCDERGGREYNLALGQKRAEAVRKTLLLLGAAEPSMEAVSFGKERPVDPGHDETAWAKNRRADINYSSR